MRDLRTHLELMDAFLERAAVCPVLQPLLASALRLHIHEITVLKLKTGYSPELGTADLALTRAISAYQFDRSDAALARLRESLDTYHAAALSGSYGHAPIRPLAELVPRAA
ncbi:hypothetical protein [Enterovirga aerilata]|uniref:Uncharacterized protein n=1 Tax=Enterovirga aerilata TaxID=2730920 RepID=A0A849I0Y9_9HYPH|nr:hypothetical protein [Enterovirga sp. DB1703]NNM73012.1 hypothetical protein [Enterovirga sp. DB1703]